MNPIPSSESISPSQARATVHAFSSKRDSPEQATGSAYFPAILIKKSDFLLKRGEPTWLERMSDSRHAMSHRFCSKCGSSLFLKNEVNDGVIVVFAGSLDDLSLYSPSRNIFVKSAWHWDLMDPNLPKSDGMLRWLRMR